jgi:8-oxo-dGTP pyrophosphatase MutT (NUDIX family)
MTADRDDAEKLAQTSPATLAKRPRDAATLILVDQSKGEPRVLMGRRRDDQIFMPGKFVFPGGRVDRADARAPSADDLKDCEIAKLMLDVRGDISVTRPRALALAAIRETFEETGLLLGVPHAGVRVPESGPWRDFLAHGIVPRLASLTFLARAITPPGRTRRYDTRFFMAEASEVALRTERTDGELSRLDWFSLEEMRALDLPGITRVIVEDLAERLGAGFPGSANAPVPFYFQRKGTSERLLLKAEAL